jgi:hypothetical protein
VQAEVFNTPSKVKRYLEANGVGVDITMSADELKLTAQRTKFLKAGASPKIRLPPTDVELQAPTLSNGFKAICDRVASGQETRPSVGQRQGDLARDREQELPDPPMRSAGLQRPGQLEHVRGLQRQRAWKRRVLHEAGRR